MGGLGTPPGALHRNFEENGASRTKDRYSGFYSLTILYMSCYNKMMSRPSVNNRANLLRVTARVK